MAYQSLLPQASRPSALAFASARGAHALGAVLALAVAFAQASAFAGRGSGAGKSASERLVEQVPWIESALRLPGGGARVKDFARYYAWSRSYPGDVRVALLRGPGQAGIYIMQTGDVPGPGAGECGSITARADVVRRRILEVTCNSGS